MTAPDGETDARTESPAQNSRRDAELLAALKVSARPDHLYVVQSASGHIKIGRARDVRSRVEDHRCSNPFEIVCVAIIPEKGGTEREVSETAKRFARLRALRTWKVRGEWLFDTKLCRDEIARVLGKRIQWRFRLKVFDAAVRKEDAAVLADERLLDRLLGTGGGENERPTNDGAATERRILAEPAPLTR